MGTIKRLKCSSERKNWDKIFNALVKMLQTQQIQLENLVKEPKLLEDRVRMQHDRWVSDIRLYEDRTSQMKRELALQDMERSLEASKSDLVMGLKQRDAYLRQLKLEYSDSELEDFKAMFNLLLHKSSDPLGSNMKTNKITDEEERQNKILEGEMKRLKHEYEKLASENSSEVSALLAEKKFAWNQLNVMENDYTSILKSKDSEVQLAKQKIEKLLTNVEQLGHLNSEKDGIIASLKNQLENMEADSSKLKDEISRLSHELEIRKKTPGASVTPFLNRCMMGAKTSTLERKKTGKNRSCIAVKKESFSAQDPQSIKDSEKGSGSSDRKRGGTEVSDTPRLFSSNFVVPKLKSRVV